jgi:hypothetical protein
LLSRFGTKPPGAWFRPAEQALLSSEETTGDLDDMMARLKSQKSPAPSTDALFPIMLAICPRFRRGTQSPYIRPGYGPPWRWTTCCPVARTPWRPCVRVQPFGAPRVGGLARRRAETSSSPCRSWSHRRPRADREQLMRETETRRACTEDDDCWSVSVLP